MLKLVVLSLLLERGLAFVFEHDWFRHFLEKKPTIGPGGVITRESRALGLKATIALAAAYAICRQNDFDVVAAIFDAPHSTPLGIWSTALVAAGGSAGAMKLFQGFLGLNKDARDAMIEARKAEGDAAKLIARANAERAIAEADAAKAIAATAQATQVDAEKRLTDAQGTATTGGSMPRLVQTI